MFISSFTGVAAEEIKKPVETKSTPEPAENIIDQPTDIETSHSLKPDSEAQQKITEQEAPPEKKDVAVQVDTAEKAVQTETTEVKVIEEEEETVVEEPSAKRGKKGQRAGDTWKFTNLNMRVDAAEEGLHRVKFLCL